MALTTWRDRHTPSPHATLDYQQAVMDGIYGPNLCPGFYCGRVYNEANRTLSPCQACPRGQRALRFDICTPCTSSLQLYDWIYLLSMVLLAVGVNQLTLDLIVRPRARRAVLFAQVVCNVFEIVLAAVIVILLNVPVGQFNLHTCGVESVMDWYTVLYNPTPNFESTVYCAHEAVYPLYSIVFEFYAVSVAFLFLFRVPLAMWKSPVLGRNAVYVMLYVYPAMALLHAIAAGIIYATFPYLLITAAVVSMAAHMASREDQRSLKLFMNTWTKPRNIVIFVVNWLLFCFSITTVLGTTSPTLLPRWAYYTVAPAIPYLFYIVTARFTDPTRPRASQLYGSGAPVSLRMRNVPPA